MRLLLAEDDPAIAALVTEILRDEEHQVVPAATAEEALRLATSTDWDLIPTDRFSRSARDLDEAGRDYLEALARRGPVIVLTARSWAARVTAEELGVAALLRKPFDLDDLPETVQAVGTLATKPACRDGLVLGGVVLFCPVSVHPAGWVWPFGPGRCGRRRAACGWC